MGALRLPHDIPWRLARVRPMSLGACVRSEEHTSELQSRLHLVCRLLLEKKKIFMSEVCHSSMKVWIDWGEGVESAGDIARCMVKVSSRIDSDVAAPRVSIKRLVNDEMT